MFTWNYAVDVLDSDWISAIKQAGSLGRAASAGWVDLPAVAGAAAVAPASQSRNSTGGGAGIGRLATHAELDPEPERKSDDPGVDATRARHSLPDSSATACYRVDQGGAVAYRRSPRMSDRTVRLSLIVFLVFVIFFLVFVVFFLVCVELLNCFERLTLPG